MRPVLSKEQQEKTVSNILVLAAGIGMFAFVYYFGKITGFVGSILELLTPFLLGFAMSFLLIPIHRRVSALLSAIPFLRGKRGAKICRVLSALICVCLLVLVLAAFLVILLPQLINSIKSILVYIADFVTANSESINELLLRYEFLKVDGEQLKIAWENIVSQLMNYTSLVFSNVMAITNGVYTLVYYTFVGIIAAFYMIIEKDRFCEQTKKLCYALMRKTACENLIRWTRRANEIFSGFIRGKILDSLIIGLLCYACMLIFRIEYALFISVIVGITNIIPFFGPFIGAIPCTLILLIVNPMSALWFAVFILLLQQVDGNIIGPKILGDYIGISPFWIMISIIVGGGLLGFAGMLLGVPVFALAYAIVKTIVEERLQRKNLPIPSASYAGATEDFMDENSPPMPPRQAIRPLFKQKERKKKQ